MSMLWDPAILPAVAWVVIPVTAMVLFAVTGLSKSIIRHRERMAKIGMGIDPDLCSSIGPSGTSRD